AGIRDFHVTGVQTCALPISSSIRWTRQHSGSSARSCSSASVAIVRKLSDDGMVESFGWLGPSARLLDVVEHGLELSLEGFEDAEIGRASCRGRGVGGGRTAA